MLNFFELEKKCAQDASYLELNNNSEYHNQYIQTNNKKK